MINDLQVKGVNKISPLLIHLVCPCEFNFAFVEKRRLSSVSKAIRERIANLIYFAKAAVENVESSKVTSPQRRKLNQGFRGAV